MFKEEHSVFKEEHSVGFYCNTKESERKKSIARHFLLNGNPPLGSGFFAEVTLSVQYTGQAKI